MGELTLEQKVVLHLAKKGYLTNAGDVTTALEDNEYAKRLRYNAGRGYMNKAVKEQILAKIKYKEYPNLIEAINTRYQKYNDTIEKIIDLENKKEIFVIRPSQKIKLNILTNNEEEIQKVYDMGVNDCKKTVNIRQYIYINSHYM